jgi:predicted RecA/RadA family phage recombinase
MPAGDRDNFNGDLEFTAPTGGVTRGRIYLISGVYVAARNTAAATEKFLGAVVGAVEVEKAAGTGKAFVAGEKIYALANVANKTGTGAVLVGFAIEAAAATAASVKVFLTGLPVTAT